MTRIHRVRAFCDWLLTLSTSERNEYEAQPEFQEFSDLTDGEFLAAMVEMRRRVRRLEAKLQSCADVRS